VATIKHAHHKVVLDTPGKDSYRYKEAGAVMSMLVTSTNCNWSPTRSTARAGATGRSAFSRSRPGAGRRFFPLRRGEDRMLRRESRQTTALHAEDGLIAIVTDMDEVYPHCRISA